MFRHLHKHIKNSKHRGVVFGLVAVLATWGAYFTYLWPHILYWGNDGIYSGWIGVWADWAAHFSFASVFAYRPVADWFISHPLYLGHKFTYPFIADLISGLLIRIHMDPVNAFVIPSIVTTVVFLSVLYFFYVKMLRSPKQAILAVSLFLLSGGLGFVYFFKTLFAEFNVQTLLFPPLEYTHIGNVRPPIEWISIITGQLLPQRAFLLGLPITLILLFILARWLEKKFEKVAPWQLILLGFCASTLIVIHVHSYIAFAVICIVTALLNLKYWKQWFIFGCSAAIPSLLLYLTLISGDIHPGFFRWYPGWLANPQAKDVNFFAFWLMNWGAFLPITILGLWAMRKRMHPFVIGGIVLFVLSNLILFQPYDWDNSKILTWAHLVFCVPVVFLLAHIWKRRVVQKILVLIVIFILTFSGFLDAFRLLHTDKISNLMWSNEELALAAQFRKISGPTDRVLVSDKHNHWVSTQTGRQILLGYKGWMWTYGINYTDRDHDMRIMFTGGPSADILLRKYQIRWVVIGDSEIADYHANESYFSTRFPVVLGSQAYRVYKIPENF